MKPGKFALVIILSIIGTSVINCERSKLYDLAKSQQNEGGGEPAIHALTYEGGTLKMLVFNNERMDEYSIFSGSVDTASSRLFVRVSPYNTAWVVFKDTSAMK